VGASYQTAVSQQGAAFSAFYLRAEPDGKWHFQLLQNINVANYTISGPVSSVGAVAGTWVHVVGVYDAAAMEGRIYVDGALSGTASVPGVAPSGPLVMGAAWSGSMWNDRLTGDIDDVWLWERPLTATEVSQLFTTGH